MKIILRGGNVVFKEIRIDVITDVWSYVEFITKYFNIALWLYGLNFMTTLTENTLYITRWISCLIFNWRYSFI